jgi:DNA polymerase III delta prime subunit
MMLPDESRHLRHHALVIEAGAEEGIAAARAWAARELGVATEGNPDVVVLRHGLLSVEDARRAGEVAASAAFGSGGKVVIIAAARVHHEAQNALLKTLEEPPEGTHIILIVPSLGMLLPTVRSRVQILRANVGHPMSNIREIPESARAFIVASREQRAAIAKRLASGKDDDDRREKRDETIALVNGIEAAAYARVKERGGSAAALLSDISILRAYLYDRSAPVKMILEHLALVTPKDLL